MPGVDSDKHCVEQWGDCKAVRIREEFVFSTVSLIILPYFEPQQLKNHTLWEIYQRECGHSR